MISEKADKYLNFSGKVLNEQSEMDILSKRAKALYINQN